MASRRRPEKTEVYELSQNDWENVGLDGEEEAEMSANEELEEEVISGNLRNPLRTVRRQTLNRHLRKSSSQSPQAAPRKPRQVRQTSAKRTARDEPATASTAQASQPETPVAMQMNMESLQMMMKQMQEMMQGQAPEKVTGTGAHRGRSVEKIPESAKVKKTPRKVRTAALTGDEAPFPTLSTVFSDDPTMNLMISLKSQTLTFKWKMLLLLLRVKSAVEIERKRWRRNPRWIMYMQGNHIAALWGHLGAARQLCYSPR